MFIFFDAKKRGTIMRYEVLSVRGRTGKYYVGMCTEYPNCIDSIDAQKDMLDGGNKIQFTGTQEEYDEVKDKLHPKVKVSIKKA